MYEVVNKLKYFLLKTVSLLGNEFYNWSNINIKGPKVLEYKVVKEYDSMLEFCEDKSKWWVQNYIEDFIRTHIKTVERSSFYKYLNNNSKVWYYCEDTFILVDNEGRIIPVSDVLYCIKKHTRPKLLNKYRKSPVYNRGGYHKGSHYKGIRIWGERKKDLDTSLADNGVHIRTKRVQTIKDVWHDGGYTWHKNRSWKSYRKHQWKEAA